MSMIEKGEDPPFVPISAFLTEESITLGLVTGPQEVTIETAMGNLIRISVSDSEHGMRVLGFIHNAHKKAGRGDRNG